MTVISEKYTGNVRYKPEAGGYFTKAKIFVEVEVNRKPEGLYYNGHYYEWEERDSTIWRLATPDDLEFLYTKGRE